MAKKIKNRDGRWTQASVDAMATGSILDRLMAIGVSVDEESFNALARGRASAMHVAQDLDDDELSSDEWDFLRFACVTLWARWLKTPSGERITAWIKEGYAAKAAAQRKVLWSQAWDALKPLIPSSTAASTASKLEELEDNVNITNLGTWLVNWALADANDSALVEDIRSRFADGEGNLPLPLRGLRALALDAAGDHEGAVVEARALIAQHPDEATTYSILSALLQRQGRMAEVIELLREQKARLEAEVARLRGRP